MTNRENDARDGSVADTDTTIEELEAGCCAPAVAATCCEPEAKASCCDAAAPATCGC